MQNQPALLCLDCCGLSSLVRQSSTRQFKPEGLMGASVRVWSHIYVKRLRTVWAQAGLERQGSASCRNAGTSAVVSSSGARSAAKLSKQVLACTACDQ